MRTLIVFKYRQLSKLMNFGITVTPIIIRLCWHQRYVHAKYYRLTVYHTATTRLMVHMGNSGHETSTGSLGVDQVAHPDSHRPSWAKLYPGRL